MSKSTQFTRFRETLREAGVTLRTHWQAPLEGAMIECYSIHGACEGAPTAAIAVHYGDVRDGYAWYPLSMSNRIEDDVAALVGETQEIDF